MAAGRRYGKRSKTDAERRIAELQELARYDQLKELLLQAGVAKQYVDELQREYKYAADLGRRFAADYAIPSLWLLIEREGGIWQYGRHNRAAGYLQDIEKYNLAAELGYTLLRYTPEQLYTIQSAEQIARTIALKTAIQGAAARLLEHIAVGSNDGSKNT